MHALETLSSQYSLKFQIVLNSVTMHVLDTFALKKKVLLSYKSFQLVYEYTLYLVFKLVSEVPKLHFKQRQNVLFYRPCFQNYLPLPHAPLTRYPRPPLDFKFEIYLINVPTILGTQASHNIYMYVYHNVCYEQPGYRGCVPTYIAIFSCKLRCISHRMPFERFGLFNIRRELCTCHLCTYNVLGGDYHYLLECPNFLVNRSQLMPNMYIYKLSDQTNNETSSIVCNLANFCKIIIEYFNLET